MNHWTNAEVEWMFGAIKRASTKYRALGIVDRDDIVQIASMKVLAKKDRKLPTPRWIYLTVRSVVIDVCRANARHPRVFETDYLENLPDPTLIEREATAEVEAELAELRALMSKGVKLLKFEQRQVLLLHLQGASNERMSAITGAKLGTVKSRLHRARLNIREMLNVT